MSYLAQHIDAVPRAADRHARLRACTLLLVDDEEANLDLLEAVLGQAGYTRLVRTTDPREVPALAAEHSPDLVLLDLHMPHRHGLEVLTDLRRATPEDEYRPVLVLTADITSETREHALRLGARDFVTKPFDTTEVLLRVENLLEARILHMDERHARERAEAAEARSSLLAEWSRLLAATLDIDTAAGQLRSLIVPRWAAACDVVLGAREPMQPGGHGAVLRLRAPVVTGDGSVGWIVLEGQGSGPGAIGADQALVDELAMRLGLAAENARLLAAAELATRERERLLAVVAHDLRNPLAAVAMYAEVLASLQPDDQNDDEGSAYTRGALATIHASTANMQRLVEDLLDAASLSGGALRIYRAQRRIGWPFEEAERILRPLGEAAGVTLAFEPESDAAARTGPIDAQRLVQLLSNLVGNAIKFTPPGGRVTVRYAVGADGVSCSVTDTGYGIAPDDLPLLFTAFRRGNRGAQREQDARRGAGLGLWIARAIVEAHGGELRVESSLGSGATFHFDLPFTEATRRWED
jgi:signal transduction histidine kinase